MRKEKREALGSGGGCICELGEGYDAVGVGRLWGRVLLSQIGEFCGKFFKELLKVLKVLGGVEC